MDDSQTYVVEQANRQKIFQMLTDSNEKDRILKEMLAAEQSFLNQSFLQPETVETSEGQPIQVARQDSLSSSDDKNSSTLFEAEKVTPDNFFDQYKIVGESPEETEKLDNLFRSNPEMLDKICTHLNFLIQEKAKDMPGVNCKEEGNKYIFERESTNEPSQEVDNIVKRAEKFDEMLSSVAPSSPSQDQSSIDTNENSQRDDAGDTSNRSLH